MSIRNTTVTPQFLEEPPDWSQPVVVETTWATETATARDGTEQRTRRRAQPRHRIEYTLAALNIREFSVRRAKSLLEQAATVVVPVWTDPFTLASAVTTGESDADLGEALALTRFKVGGYAYLTDGSLAAFRRITAIDGETLTLAAGTGTFASGATAYPCITGMAASGAVFTPDKLDDTGESIAIEEL